MPYQYNFYTDTFDFYAEVNILSFKAGVANEDSLPSSGNEVNDARITNDTHHLYVWNGTAWVDQGDIFDIDWSVITNKPTSSVSNIDDSVSKKHTQNTDTKLDEGGDNEVSAENLKDAYTHSQATSGNPHSVDINDILSTGTQGQIPFINSDGDDFEYNSVLSTIEDTGHAWDIDYISYIQSKAVNDSIEGMSFKPDGTQMYYVSKQYIYVYDLSIAWDISTLVYNNSYDMSAQDSYMYALYFKSDGTKMYLGGEGNKKIYEYSLGSAWDISTKTYNTALDISAKSSYLKSITFNGDGTKLYFTSTNDIYEYNVSTPYDVSTAVYSKELDLMATYNINNYANGITFNGDGSKLYLCGRDDSNAHPYLYELNVSSAYDISSTTLDSKVDIYTYQTFNRGMYLKSDGLKIYVANSPKTVFQYNLSALGLKITTTITDGSNSVSVQEIKNTTDAETGIDAIIGDGVNQISTGMAIAVEVPHAMTLTTARIFAIDGNSGSIVIDIWKDTYANFPPTDSDSITGGNEPEISSGTKAEDTSLNSWTKSLSKGDILYFNVDSVTTLTKVLISLKGVKGVKA